MTKVILNFIAISISTIALTGCSLLDVIGTYKPGSYEAISKSTFKPGIYAPPKSTYSPYHQTPPVYNDQNTNVKKALPGSFKDKNLKFCVESDKAGRGGCVFPA